MYDSTDYTMERKSTYSSKCSFIIHVIIRAVKITHKLNYTRLKEINAVKKINAHTLIL